MDEAFNARLNNGNFILKKLKEENYDVYGITGDLIMEEWEDMLHQELIDPRLAKKIIQNIKDYGWRTPRKIQLLSISRLIKGGDFISQASAGNGKTGAFGIPCLVAIDITKKKLQKIIVAPNNPLVDQIYDILKHLSENTGINIQKWRGGLEYPRDKNPHIIVASPGRLVDMLQPKTKNGGSPYNLIDTSYVTSLILDEGDELLNINFRDNIKLIIETLPESCQVGIFSATISREILNICEKFMTNQSILIVPEKRVITTRVIQFYANCNDINDKMDNIVHCINENLKKTIIIFCNTCTGIRKISEVLNSQNPIIQHICINGKMIESERKQSIDTFISGKCRILLASDIVARGFDFNSISLVINFDMPIGVDTYIHRIGRAGRAGELGHAVTLTSSESDISRLKYIVKIHEIPIKLTETKTLDDGTKKFKYRF